jgi:hypothetical protein
MPVEGRCCTCMHVGHVKDKPGSVPRGCGGEGGGWCGNGFTIGGERVDPSRMGLEDSGGVSRREEDVGSKNAGGAPWCRFSCTAYQLKESCQPKQSSYRTFTSF